MYGFRLLVRASGCIGFQDSGLRGLGVRVLRAWGSSEALGYRASRISDLSVAMCEKLSLAALNDAEGLNYPKGPRTQVIGSL